MKMVILRQWYLLLSSKQMTNKFNGTHLESLDKRLRDLRKEVEGDLERYKDPYYMAFHMSEEHYWVSENDRIDVRLTEKCNPWIKIEDHTIMCSCGARQKSKCVKESGLGTGKKCLREDE